MPLDGRDYGDRPIVFICDCACACAHPVDYDGAICTLCDEGFCAPGFDPDAEVKFQRENPRED